MYGLVDYGAIADAAVDEMFGFDEDEEFGRRPRPVRRAIRRTRRRRAKRRAALGSPAWRAGIVPGQGYDTGAVLLAPEMADGLGSDLLDAEIDALLAEDEDEDEGYADEGEDYGYDADDYYGFDADDEFGLAADDEYGDDEDDEFGDDEMYVDEFGRLRRFRRRGRRRGRGRRRRGRGRGRAFRRGMKMARRKMKKRRRRRRKRREEDEGEDQPQLDIAKFNPLLLRALQAQAGEEEEEEEGPQLPFNIRMGAYGYDDGYGYYGNDAPPAQVQPPPSHAPSFGESVVMGAGVGLGFMVAAFGVSALARGLGAK